MRTNDENQEKCLLGDYKLIQYQILQTSIKRTIWQMLRRITNKILGVKGIIKNFIALSVFRLIFRVIPSRNLFMLFVHFLTF